MQRMLLLVALLMFACLRSGADVVQLKNGDRVTGAVITLEGDGLLVKSKYLGDLKVKLAGVERISADQPLHLRTGAKMIETRAIQVSGNELHAETAQHGTFSMPVSEVAFLVSNAEFLKRQNLEHAGVFDMWNGSADLGFSTARGNSGATTLDVGVKGARITARDKFDVFFTSLFARNSASQDRATSANSIRSGISYSVNVTPRLFTFGFTNFERDELQQLDLRNVLGGGLGLRLVKSPKAALDVFSGGSLNQELYSGTPSRRSGEALLGQELTYSPWSRTTASERLTVFPNLSDTGEYRVSLDSSATVKLNSWLGWQVTLSNIYVSNPPLGAANNDLLLSTGIRLSLGEKRSFNPQLGLAEVFQ